MLQISTGVSQNRRWAKEFACEEFVMLEHSVINYRFCKPYTLNSFYSCLCPALLILVAVSLEPALLQISTADVAQKGAQQSGKPKMIWRTLYLLSRYVLCH